MMNISSTKVKVMKNYRWNNTLTVSYRACGKWKIQLTMKMKFLSSTGSNNKRTFHAKSNHMEITIGNDTDKIIQELFNSFLNRYKVGLEQ